jgi:hypothetical protein
MLSNMKELPDLSDAEWDLFTIVLTRSKSPGETTHPLRARHL